jgi:hypothetical protein
MKISVVIHKEEIVSDVSSIAHVVGRRISTSENFEKASDIQTPFQKTDSAIVARALRTAFSNVKKKCSRYLLSGRISDSNALQSLAGDYELILDMPDGFNIGVTAALTDAINNYCVSYCIYNIFEKTNPQEAENYLLKAASKYDEIKSCLEQRKDPVRRKTRSLY